MRRAFTAVVSSHRSPGISPRSSFHPPNFSLYLSSSATKSLLWSSSSHKLHVQCSSSNTQLAQRGPISYTPLSERASAHTSSVEELWKWRKWAQDLAISVGEKYRIADGGPDSRDLLREVEWMLEDAVSHVLSPSMPARSMQGHLNQSDGAETGTELRHVEATSFLRALKRQGIKNYEPSELQIVVCLRASLDELSALWTERVQHRRPFQYIIGSAHWRDFVLFVKEGVLIPRPETEQMIDLAQEVINVQSTLSKGLWADLGTGSGALAIGLGSILHPQGNVVAVDTSEEALSIASLNIKKYGLQDKIKVLKGSWFSPLEDLKGKLAGVLSNPPYIPSSHIATLQAEVGHYEPRKALDGGQQGTDHLMVICEGATWALQSGGCIILETNGGDQAKAVAIALKSMPGDPFCDVQLIKDYAGVVRFVRAKHV